MVVYSQLQNHGLKWHFHDIFVPFLEQNYQAVNIDFKIFELTEVPIECRHGNIGRYYS